MAVSLYFCSSRPQHSKLVGNVQRTLLNAELVVEYIF